MKKPVVINFPGAKPRETVFWQSAPCIKNMPAIVQPTGRGEGGAGGDEGGEGGGGRGSDGEGKEVESRLRLCVLSSHV